MAKLSSYTKFTSTTPPWSTPAIGSGYFHKWGPHYVSKEEYEALDTFLFGPPTGLLPAAREKVLWFRSTLGSNKATEIDIYVLRQLTKNNTLPIRYVTQDDYIDGYVRGIGFPSLGRPPTVEAIWSNVTYDELSIPVPTAPPPETFLDKLNRALLEVDNVDEAAES